MWKKSLRTCPTIWFVWWWSWWHVIPIISLIEYAQENKALKSSFSYVWFWERNSLEEQFAKKNRGIDFVPILAWKIRKYITFKSVLLTIVDLFKVIIWLFQAVYFLWKKKIDIVFCKWWYVAFPIVVWACILRIPLVFHESDSVPWKINKYIARRSKKKFTWFSWLFDDEIVVWQILSLQLASPKKIPLEGFDITKTTCLVMGWSQWARALFETIPKLTLRFPDIQFILILWLKNAELEESLTEDWHVWTVWFVEADKLAYLYSLCDIALTRWSATSLAGQELYSIKKIIVPLPISAWNHQYINWQWYAKNKNDYCITQDHNLFENISLLLSWPLRGYKKDSHIPHKNLKETITQPHATIRNEIISVVKTPRSK